MKPEAQNPKYFIWNKTLHIKARTTTRKVKNKIFLLFEKSSSHNLDNKILWILAKLGIFESNDIHKRCWTIFC